MSGGYRSAQLNAFGNAMQREGKRGYPCASNEANAAGHILPQAQDRSGTCAMWTG